jgi:hypothetical protein
VGIAITAKMAIYRLRNLPTNRNIDNANDIEMDIIKNIDAEYVDRSVIRFVEAPIIIIPGNRW